jgi:hypothetical protein
VGCLSSNDAISIQNSSPHLGRSLRHSDRTDGQPDINNASRHHGVLTGFHCAARRSWRQRLDRGQRPWLLILVGSGDSVTGDIGHLNDV